MIASIIRPDRSRLHVRARFLLAWGLLALAWSAPALAATTVHRGEVRVLTRVEDLDLQGEFVYAINFSQNDPVRTVAGVRFLPDSQSIPGAALTGPQQVSPWETRPELGATADANQLEEILQDIRWANTGSGERLRAALNVIPGDAYQLQILISANRDEDRRWDIRVNGLPAVDEITSVGVSPGPGYSRQRAVLYQLSLTAEGTVLVIEMGQLFGANDGGDRNPIWQALTLERITAPPTPDDLQLDPDRFFGVPDSIVGTFTVLDRKFQAAHHLALVPGEGSIDNSRFTLSGSELRTSSAPFGAQPPGTRFSIRVRASDVAAPERWIERAFPLILAEPHAPLSLVSDADSVSTLARPGDLLARIQVTDPDSFDRHSLTLVEGPGATANALLQVTGDGVILAAPLAGSSGDLAFRLRATDRAGLTVEAPLRLALRAPAVRLNELLASESAEANAIGPAPGGEWIELLNTRRQYVNLSGWHLSDNPDLPKRWTFPERVLGPGASQLVLADGRDLSSPNEAFDHANFSLSGSGERLRLSTPDGNAHDQLAFPVQFPGVAYGRTAAGAAGYLRTPTPLAPNAELAPAGANTVHFSRTRGFPEAPFDLELTAELPGSTIRYTLDGSLPTPSTGTLYHSPIRISPNPAAATRGTRIVRAIALHPDAAYAPVATQTYLFLAGVTGPTTDGVIGQSRLVTSITRHPVYGPQLEAALRDLPSLSLVLPGGGPSSTERRASIEWMDPTGAEPGFQAECGIESTGTTSLASPKLSMSAKFRTRYGLARLEYPLYARGTLAPEGAATDFKELRLRGHSHDNFFWLGTRENPPVPYGNPPVTRSGDAQLARNLWMDEMQLLMGQPGKHGRQVHLYLNGAYHGIYHVHEHADEDFMASYFPGSAEDFHFTSAAIGGSEHANGGSWSGPWSDLKASLGNYAEARRWIDVTNLCDYMVLSFYAGNDWDWSARHNWSAAGPVLPDRGGWKFFQQDSDISLQDVTADCTDQDVPDGIFTALMRFPDFRVLFRDRVYRHCFHNGMLTPARAAAVYDSRMNELLTALVAETARWQPSSSVATLPWDRDQEWTNEWRYLRTTFFPQRTDRLLQQLRQRSGWWTVDPPSLQPHGGSASPGSPIQLTAPSGTVYYTTDGSDPRLPGGRIHPDAHAFGGSSRALPLLSAGASWAFLDTGAIPPADWRVRPTDPVEWRRGPAEIGYGDGGESTIAGFIDTDPVVAGVQKNITTYFRTTFDAPGLETYLRLRLRLLRDDGALVFINGREVLRDNLPAGPVTAETRAITGIGGADESAFQEWTLDLASAALLPTGNVLAVEIHQQSPDSSDISFDLELLADLATTAGPTLTLGDRPLLLRARAYSGSDWSALVEALFLPDSVESASASNLVISELHYHPIDPADSEFIELLNTGPRPLDLSGVRLAGGVEFTLPTPAPLAPGERLVLARDPVAFDARFLDPASPFHRPGLRRLGPWTGSLSNSGESLSLLAADGSLLLEFTYGTQPPWPFLADGHGPSLELIDPQLTPAGIQPRSEWLADPEHWRASQPIHGSPGHEDFAPPTVVINEVLAAPPLGAYDAVELLNRGSQPVRLDGWYLSDTPDRLQKYRFPAGTTLAPAARLVLRETDFNQPAHPPALVPFAFDSLGDGVYLASAHPNGEPLRLIDGTEFGPSPRGWSLGRLPDGLGDLASFLVPTLGAPNQIAAGSFLAWQSQAFPIGTPAAQTLPGADFDLDGIPNAAEYAFALFPDRAEDPPVMQAIQPTEDGVAFHYRSRTGATDVIYRFEGSPDLTNWSGPVEIVDSQPGPPANDGSTPVQVRLRWPESLRFLPARYLRVTAELQP